MPPAQLPDVTTVADGSRLQDMILDLRQDHMRVTERASMLESLNTELNEKNSALESRVLQLERQVCALRCTHAHTKYLQQISAKRV